MRAQRAETSKTVGKLPPAEREQRRGGHARARRPDRRPSKRRWRRPRRRSRRPCSSCPTSRTPRCRSGPDETANVVVREAGEMPSRFDFHAAAALGPRAGARHHRLRARREDLRLALLRADAARARRLQRALISWMLDLHVARARLHRGLPAGDGASASAWSAPATCRSSATPCTATSRRTSGSCPTAEVPVTNLYRDEILERRAAADLPRRLHAVLPARADVGRPRRARHQARPPVRQGRDGEVRRPRDLRRRAATRCSTTPRTSAAGSASRIASSRCAPAT